MDAISNPHQQEETKMCFHCCCEEATTKEYLGSCADCFWDCEGEFRKWRGSFNYYHEHEGKSEEEADSLARQDLEPWYLQFLEFKKLYESFILKGMTDEDAKKSAQLEFQNFILNGKTKVEVDE